MNPGPRSIGRTMDPGPVCEADRSDDGSGPTGPLPNWPTVDPGPDPRPIDRTVDPGPPVRWPIGRNVDPGPGRPYMRDNNVYRRRVICFCHDPSSN